MIDDPLPSDRKCCVKWVGALAAIGLLVTSGCGGDEFAARYPVSGSVTYKGKPVESGSITFTPTDEQKGRSAGGKIADGKYSLTTVNHEDGAVPGQYRVTISARRETLDGADAKTKLMFEKARSTPGVSLPPQVQKVLKQEDLVPSKYASTDKSNLKADVEAKTNEINFELTDD